MGFAAIITIIHHSKIFKSFQSFLRKESIMGKKAIKQHIKSNGNRFYCGLNARNRIKDAFIDPEDNQLYSYEGELIDHSNMHLICTNCLKLGFPELHNRLLNDKAIESFRNSLPKSNRERKRLKSINRNKRCDSRKSKPFNVIYLGYNPIIEKPIMDPSRLLPLPESFQKKESKKQSKKKAMAKTKEPIIELTEIVNDQLEDSFIEFGNQVAIVRGFGNYWKVIYKNDDSTIEDLSDWIPYAAAMNEAQQLVA